MTLASRAPYPQHTRQDWYQCRCCIPRGWMLLLVLVLVLFPLTSAQPDTNAECVAVRHGYTWLTCVSPGTTFGTNSLGMCSGRIPVVRLFCAVVPKHARHVQHRCAILGRRHASMVQQRRRASDGRPQGAEHQAPRAAITTIPCRQWNICGSNRTARTMGGTFTSTRKRNHQRGNGQPTWRGGGSVWTRCLTSCKRVFMTLCTSRPRPRPLLRS